MVALKKTVDFEKGICAKLQAQEQPKVVKRLGEDEEEGTCLLCFFLYIFVFCSLFFLSSNLLCSLLLINSTEPMMETGHLDDEQAEGFYVKYLFSLLPSILLSPYLYYFKFLLHE